MSTDFRSLLQIVRDNGIWPDCVKEGCDHMASLKWKSKWCITCIEKDPVNRLETFTEEELKNMRARVAEFL